MKKIILYTSAIILFLLVFSAQADELNKGQKALTFEEYNYHVLDNNTVAITRYNGTDTAIVIPNTIDGYTVSSIGKRSFANNDKLQTVIIADSITCIDDYAFLYCSSLSNVTIPDSVIEIGEGAFNACSKLSNIIIPASVTSITSNPFINCTSLLNIYVPQENPVLSIRNDALYCISDNRLICYPEGLEVQDYFITQDTEIIGPYAFAGCSMANITIPDSVLEIQDNAFYSCTSLTNVIIPSNVTVIGNHAFDFCTHLSNITIPESVTTIGDQAFESCSQLFSISIPDSVLTVGKNPFSKCDYLTNINISPNHPILENVDNVIFNKITKTLISYPCSSSLTTYSIPQNIVTIGDYAFCECQNLNNIIIPNSVTTIGELAFFHCYGLSSITLPASVTNINEKAFTGCNGISFFVSNDSYAAQYCIDNELPYTILLEEKSDAVSPTSNDSILFRNIPWFEQEITVRNTLENKYGLYPVQLKEKTRIESMFHTTVNMFPEFYIENAGITLTYHNVSVAGYNASLNLSFAYPIESDKVNYETESSQFYMAEYLINNIEDAEKAFNDLSEKLSQLYGTAQDKSYYSEYAGPNPHPKGMLWTATDNSTVWLALDTGYSPSDHKQVFIFYAAPNSDDYLIQLETQIKKEASDREAAEREQNSNNFEGL